MKIVLTEKEVVDAVRERIGQLLPKGWTSSGAKMLSGTGWGQAEAEVVSGLDFKTIAKALAGSVVDESKAPASDADDDETESASGVPSPDVLDVGFPDPHPEYGPCDEDGPRGCCAECRRKIYVLTQTLDLATKNLLAARDGTVRLRAVAQKALDVFDAGFCDRDYKSDVAFDKLRMALKS